ncbi:hypothetical protein MH117_17195 [Paenibacillus sp. ACRRX]|uniref:TadE/TadG family type IV pilus assembly protein n=1 Tax=unclassified Paenibacillus TaxID=185978 RepID=UPI001EF7495F|nr:MULTISPECIES: hypothetical protein [unclassified Paenibacillus]MCG7409155.1 hypothetical protein [Paenibacillus sp. ACRRX]MDK8181851.1 hypothetical protein [Paenibacillus sp. UMB4589-SE434]
MKLTRDEEGSLTLEAALILPWFLAFVLALIALIQLSIVDMSLRSTVSQSSKQLAVYMYAVEKTLQTSKITVIADVVSKANDTLTSMESNGQVLGGPAALIPKEMLDLAFQLRGMANNAYNQGEQWANQKVIQYARGPLKSFMTQYADKSILDPGRLEIIHLDVPNFLDKSKAYLGIEAQYKQKLLIPFFTIEINVRKKAYERVWIGNT